MLYRTEKTPVDGGGAVMGVSVQQVLQKIKRKFLCYRNKAWVLMRKSDLILRVLKQFFQRSQGSGTTCD